MTTLTTTPLAPLLDRLFDEADAAAAETEAAVADLSVDVRARLMRSNTDYRDLYGRLKNAPLAISRETGALLYMLARSSHAGRSSSSGPRSGSRPCISLRPSRTMAAAI